MGNVKDDRFNVELENVWKENQTKSKPEQKTVILKIGTMLCLQLILEMKANDFINNYLNIHGGVMFPMALLRNPSPVPEIEVASPPQ